MRPQVRRLIIALWVVVVVAVLGFAARLYLTGGGSNPLEAAGSSMAPAIGGPFTLVDQTGKTVTEADFRGKWMLIYFGYTYCPDVCPTALTTMVDALDQLGDKAKNVVPVFVTIDPERDTPGHLADYVAAFSPQMVGLTGAPQQIAAAAKAYRVYYAKAKDSGSSSAYLMDHSSIVYLVDPEGKFRQHFSSHQINADEMARRLRDTL